jgi:HK97 family phage portal protein
MNGFEIQVLPGGSLPSLEVLNVGQTSGNTSPAAWFLDWATMGQTSDSGLTVNGYTALTYCPLWQGVNIIAGDVGQTPIRLLKDEFYEQRQHPAWNLLRVRPNELQTPNTYLETMMQWALIWGNGVAAIHRRGSRPVDLIPLRPDCLWPEVIAFDEAQVMVYHYWSPTTGREFTLFPHEVVHVTGLSGDGLWGYALHEIAKNTIGHGLALEKHGNKSFANGARPSGVLKHPGKLTPEARSNLRTEWEALHGGLDNAARIAILSEAMEFQAMSMTNIDAQWIEAKKMNRLDAASLLNLPAHKLNSLEDSSVRSNLEEQNADYTQRTLSRWFNKFDQEYRRKLLTEQEWLSDTFKFVFDVDEFLRADVDTLSQVADRLVKAELMNRNEGRRYFRLPPYPGGERFGSPAINPQKDFAGDGEEKKPETPEIPEKKPDAVRNALLAALIERLEHVIQIESSELAKAAKSSKNFVAWLDEHYISHSDHDSKFLKLYDGVMEKHLTAAESVGINVTDVRAMVNSWALGRQRSILEACSSVTQEQLIDCVRGFVVSNPVDIATQLIGVAVES